MGLSAGAIIAIIGVAVAAAGAGVSAYAASEQAASSRKRAKAEEAFRLAEAENAREAAAFEERQFRRRIAMLQGQNTNAVVAAGFDPTFGSPLFLELDTVRQAEINALNIRRTGQVNASASELEARLARMRGSFGPSTGAIAGSGALNAAGSSASILGNWYRYNQGSGGPMPTQAG